MKWLVCLIGLIVWLGMGMASPAVAVYPFQSPRQQQQFLALTEQLRCLVCQNESLAASNASLAKALRNEVYVMVKKGDSNAQIKHYLVARYGDFVLFKPRFAQRTWLLWLGPLLLLLIGCLVLWRVVHRYRSGA